MTILMIILKIIGIIIGAYAVFMLIVVIVPGFSVPKQPLEKAKQMPGEVEEKTSRSRKDVTFKIKGTSLSAWLYLPEDLNAPAPVSLWGMVLGQPRMQDWSPTPFVFRKPALRYSHSIIDILAKARANPGS